jgi:hypothetical protein
MGWRLPRLPLYRAFEAVFEIGTVGRKSVVEGSTPILYEKGSVGAGLISGGDR